MYHLQISLHENKISLSYVPLDNGKRYQRASEIQRRKIARDLRKEKVLRMTTLDKKQELNFTPSPKALLVLGISAWY
jgi:hypothetical protein